MEGEYLLGLLNDVIDRVVFYKSDQLTTDLICCDVHCGDTVHFAHEEAAVWKLLIAKLEQLPGFATDWFGKVSQPPFARSETIAFDR